MEPVEVRPSIDKSPPTKVFDRTETSLAAKRSLTLILDPKRTKDRTETELPARKDPTTLVRAAIFVEDCTLSVKPSLAAALTDNELSNTVESLTLALDPHLMKDNTDRELPRVTNSSTEVDLLT